MNLFILQRPMLAFVGNDSGLVDVGLVQGAAGFGSVQKLAAHAKRIRFTGQK
jgi:hypothetical protein